MHYPEVYGSLKTDSIFGHSEDVPLLVDVVPGRPLPPGLEDNIVLPLHRLGHDLVDVLACDELLPVPEDLRHILRDVQNDAHLLLLYL